MCKTIKGGITPNKKNIIRNDSNYKRQCRKCKDIKPFTKFLL